MQTPPFFRWALEVACPLRMGKHWSDPAQTERQLRSVRCYAEAKLEGRIFDGVAVEQVVDDELPTNGFLVDEVFQAYGGEDELERCRGCAANVARHIGQLSYAGCYGLVTFDDLSPHGEEFDLAAQKVKSLKVPPLEFSTSSHGKRASTE